MEGAGQSREHAAESADTGHLAPRRVIPQGRQHNAPNDFLAAGNERPYRTEGAAMPTGPAPGCKSSAAGRLMRWGCAGLEGS